MKDIKISARAGTFAPLFCLAVMLVISGCAQTPGGEADLLAEMSDLEDLRPVDAESAFAGNPQRHHGGGSGPMLIASSEEQPPEEPDERDRSVASYHPDPDAEGDFHFTAIRNWLYINYVPDKSDPLIYGLELNSAWEWGDYAVSNISYIELADYPEAVDGMPWGNPVLSGNGGTGFSDLLTAFLFAPKGSHASPHHFALGFAAQLPTAASKSLGSGKWSLGPAAEYAYTSGDFFAAFVAINVFSVAGDSDRKGVNMLMIKPMITYEVIEDWKLVYMPYGISVYWNKEVGDAIYIPLGGGIQYDFSIGEQKMAASLQIFEYVRRSSKGSKSDLRFMLEFDF